jgi:hypothetical protein
MDQKLVMAKTLYMLNIHNFFTIINVGNSNKQCKCYVITLRGCVAECASLLCGFFVVCRPELPLVGDR